MSTWSCNKTLCHHCPATNHNCVIIVLLQDIFGPCCRSCDKMSCFITVLLQDILCPHSPAANHILSSLSCYKTSQIFIVLLLDILCHNCRATRHLVSSLSCYKTSCILRVVGGLETLDKMEAIETDDKGRPKVILLFYI